MMIILYTKELEKMGNHEIKYIADSVHLFLAFKRTKDKENGSTKCLRMVIKNEAEDLEVLKSKLKVLGGTWRIHKTVNARDVQKAKNILIKTILDYPEKASYIDSAWRTALLQRECIFGEKKFMFDVDTSDVSKQYLIDGCIKASGGRILETIKTPSGGWHIITKPFDTREVMKLGNIDLLRDGYIYVTSIGDKNE